MKAPTQLVDIYPTVLTYAEVPPKKWPALDGSPLQPLLPLQPHLGNEARIENALVGEPGKIRDCETTLVTRIAATSKSQIASDCNRNSKKSLRLRKHPLKPTLWTRESPVLCGFYSVSEAPQAQYDFCDCDTAISAGKACDFEVVIANR